MAGQRLVELLHHSNPNNTEFPTPGMKRDVEGRLRGSDDHLNNVKTKTADNTG